MERFSLLPRGILLVMVASQLLIPGLVIMSTPALPIVPTAGSEKHAGLKNRPAGTLLFGLHPPTTLMRGVSEEDPVMSSEGEVVKLGVNGAPVEKVLMPEITQLS